MKNTTVNRNQPLSISILVASIALLIFGIPRLLNLGAVYQKMLLDINPNAKFPLIYTMPNSVFAAFIAVFSIALIVKEMRLKSNQQAIYINLAALIVSICTLFFLYVLTQAPMMQLIEELLK
jgi:hypothetical protein